MKSFSPNTIYICLTQIEKSKFIAKQKVQDFADTHKFGPNLGKDMVGKDIRATCHMICISMNKSFVDTEQHEVHIREFVKKRTQVILAALRNTDGVLCLADHFWTGLGDVFRSLPKLRAMLFELLYENLTKSNSRLLSYYWHTHPWPQYNALLSL